MKLFDNYKDIKPDFVSEEGHKWYVMDCLTNHCAAVINPLKQMSKLNAKCFLWVKNDDSEKEFVLIGENQNIIHTNINYEAMAVYIECKRVSLC